MKFDTSILTFLPFVIIFNSVVSLFSLTVVVISRESLQPAFTATYSSLIGVQEVTVVTSRSAEVIYLALGQVI